MAGRGGSGADPYLGKLRQQVFRLGARQRPVLLDRRLAGEGGGGALRQACAGRLPACEVREELPNHLCGTRGGQWRGDAQHADGGARRRLELQAKALQLARGFPGQHCQGRRQLNNLRQQQALHRGCGTRPEQALEEHPLVGHVLVDQHQPLGVLQYQVCLTVLADVTTPACGGRAGRFADRLRGERLAYPGPPAGGAGGRRVGAEGEWPAPGLCRRQRDRSPRCRKAFGIDFDVACRVACFSYLEQYDMERVAKFFFSERKVQECMVGLMDGSLRYRDVRAKLAWPYFKYRLAKLGLPFYS